MTWDAAAGATSYKLRWKQSGGAFEAGNEVVTVNTSAAVTVADYGDWEAELEGCNAAGCGPAATVEFTVERQSAARGYRGQLGEVLVELSLRKPPPTPAPTAAPEGTSGRSVQGQQDPSPTTTSIVYLIGDSVSMDSDFPELRSALEAVRDSEMPNTKVALTLDTNNTTRRELFGLTSHSSAPWDTHINTLNGTTVSTALWIPLGYAKSLLDADGADIKKIILLTDEAPSVLTTRDREIINQLKTAGIVLDTVAFGVHFSNRFTNLATMAADTGGQSRQVPKPRDGTTNDPAVTPKAMPDILKESVIEDQATLFLYDISTSIFLGPESAITGSALASAALNAAAAKAQETTDAEVGLAVFSGFTGLEHKNISYEMLFPIGSSSLTFDGVQLHSKGGSDIDDALNKAYEAVTGSEVTQTDKRVVLISDGISGTEVQESTLNKYKDDDSVTLDVVAIVPHADRVLLKSWADADGGSFNVAREPS